MLFETLIAPLFDYCDYVSDSLSVKDQYTLQKLPNCYLRNILMADWMTPNKQLHDELDFLKLDKKVTCIHAVKCTKHKEGLPLIVSPLSFSMLMRFTHIVHEELKIRISMYLNAGPS